MALTSYETNTKAILQNPGAPTSLYSTADLDRWINLARGQLAGDSESVRAILNVNTAVGVRNYNFSALTGLPTGVQGPLHIRAITYNVGTGQKWITPRAWSWFLFYHLNNPVPVNGAPRRYSQFAQGVLGSFYLDPPPDQIYTLNCDTVCRPIDLVDDTTAEAIPYPWTDAVPYYAAYLAYLSAQSPARQADAQRMFGIYSEFVTRARQFSNPDVLRGQYLQSTDQTILNKLGLQPKQAAGG